MKLFFELSGTKIELDIDPEEPISSIKQKVAKKLRVHFRQIWLFYKQQIVFNDSAMSQYSITENSVLSVVISTLNKVDLVKIFQPAVEILEEEIQLNLPDAGDEEDATQELVRDLEEFSTLLRSTKSLAEELAGSTSLVNVFILLLKTCRDQVDPAVSDTLFYEYLSEWIINRIQALRAPALAPNLFLTISIEEVYAGSIVDAKQRINATDLVLDEYAEIEAIHLVTEGVLIIACLNTLIDAHGYKLVLFSKYSLKDQLYFIERMKHACASKNLLFPPIYASAVYDPQNYATTCSEAPFVQNIDSMQVAYWGEDNFQHKQSIRRALEASLKITDSRDCVFFESDSACVEELSVLGYSAHYVDPTDGFCLSRQLSTFLKALEQHETDKAASERVLCLNSLFENSTHKNRFTIGNNPDILVKETNP